MSFSLTAGAGVEHRSHAATPSNDLIAAIDSSGALGTHTFPSLIAAAGFANYQRPAFSISPEDGVQLSVTVRDRLRSGGTASGAQSVSTVGTAAIYKSFDFPGFAHHVLALRGAVGYADERSNGYYFVGGVSGNTFEIVPGYVVGEGRKTFPVRGFQAGTIAGIRAVTGSAEYRIPLFLIGKSPSILPFFFDRSSITLFGDYGTAWCPTVRAGREVCNRAGQADRPVIGSVGGELNLNLGVLSWDSPYRFRLGAVTPTYSGSYFGRKSLQVYVVAGTSF
jgi:outer membrane protein assembly factor BamA